MLAQLDAAHGFASACPLYPRSRPDCGHCRGSESGQSLTFASAQRARPLPANAPLTFAGIMPSADVADTNDRVWFREGCGPEAEIQDLASVDTQLSPTQAIHTQKKSGSKPDEAISSRPRGPFNSSLYRGSSNEAKGGPCRSQGWCPPGRRGSGIEQASYGKCGTKSAPPFRVPHPRCVVYRDGDDACAIRPEGRTPHPAPRTPYGWPLRVSNAWPLLASHTCAAPGRRTFRSRIPYSESNFCFGTLVSDSPSCGLAALRRKLAPLRSRRL